MGSPISQERLADEPAIRALCAGYADAVTRRDAAAFEALWCEDGVWEAFGSAFERRARLVAVWRGAMQGFPFVYHVVHSGLVELGARAGRRCRWPIGLRRPDRGGTRRARGSDPARPRALRGERGSRDRRRHRAPGHHRRTALDLAGNRGRLAPHPPRRHLSRAREPRTRVGPARCGAPHRGPAAPARHARTRLGCERLLATAQHAIHAIPHVCRAAPGIRTFLDLPLVTGRRALAR